jgi:hypothetical protein
MIGKAFSIYEVSKVLISDIYFSRSVPKTYKDKYEAVESDEIDSKKKLKETLKVGLKNVSTYSGHFTRVVGNEIRMGGLESFGKHLLEQLEHSVKETIMKAPLKTQPHNSYYGNEEIVKKMLDAGAICIQNSSHHQFVKSSKVFVVQSKSGGGKTALLSYMSNLFVKVGYIVLHSFVRTWEGSFSVNSMIRRFCHKLMYRLKLPFETLPSEITPLKERWILLMKMAISLGNVIIVLIDGLDRMKDDQERIASLSIGWMPRPSELGTEGFDGTVWIFSTRDPQTFFVVKNHNPTAENIVLPPFSESQKRSFVNQECANRNIILGPRLTETLLRKKSSESFLYIHFLLTEAADSSPPNLDFRFETETDIVRSILFRLEEQCGKEQLRNLFSYLSLSKNGLREVEILGLMKFSLIRWNLLLKKIEPYITKTSTGFIMLYRESFSAAVRLEYISKELEFNFHKNLAEYYCKVWESDKLTGHGQLSSLRVIDIPYHFFLSRAPLKDIVKVLCNLDYIRCSFECNASKLMANYFKRATIIASKSELDSLKILSEFYFYAVRSLEHLKLYPELAFPLALSLPNRLCTMVKNEALDLMKSKVYNRHYLCSINRIEEQLEMATMGSHTTKIVYLGVHYISTLGKCCISVSLDGTTILWNATDNLLKLKTLLYSPLEFDELVQCTVSLSGPDLIAFGTSYGHLIVFNILNGQKHAHIDHQYFGGRIFFSEDMEGIWRICKKVLEFVAFIPSNGNIIQKNNIKTSFIITCSADFSLLAFLNVNESRGFTIISTKKMREICHFKENDISELSIGAFSYLKDTIAITLTSGDIMVTIC